MFKVKVFLDYTNLYFRNNYEKNDKILLKDFQSLKKLYCVICGKYRTFEKPKTPYIFEKTLTLSIIRSKCKNEDEKIFKEEVQLRY